MKYMPPNAPRAIMGMVALAIMVAGAWILWGGGAALFIGGLYIAFDMGSDEAIERITKTTRWKQPSE